MRKTVLASGVALVVIAAACGGSTTQVGDGSSGSSGGTSGASGGTSGTSGGTSGASGASGSSGSSGTSGTSGNPPPAGSYTVTFPAVTIPANTEKTQCITKRLGNPASFHAGSIHDVLGDGSHHMIVYKVADTTEQLTPVDCQPFTDTLNPAKGAPLIVTQKKDDLLQLPPNVGYTLDANQMVRLEVHYINPGSKTLTLTASSTLSPIADADFKYEAGFLFIGDPDISIPAKSQATVGPVFFQLPAEYATANFFAMTGHEHQFGTNVKVDAVANASDPGTPVYNVPNWLWSEPKTETFNPTFKVPGGGGFRFSCDWNNTSDNTVTFGESANNEMCFFWAYYYPSTGAKVCFHSQKFGGPAGVDVCCPGAAASICKAFGG